MRTTNYFYCIIFIIFFTASCKKESPKSNTLNGVWKSIGSGWLLHIEDSTKYTAYDYTSISCLSSRKAQLDELINAIRIQNDTLFLEKGIMTYSFIKTDKLPQLCNEMLSEEKSKEVLFNFEVFAETIKAHYVFMELNDINWPELYAIQKKRLEDNPTEIELYAVLEETLETLNDNHAYLEATEAFYNTLEDNENEEQESDLPEYGDFQVADMVAKHHMIEDMTDDSWLIKWGKMEDNIGYIQIKAMWLYADLDIPKTLIENYGYVDAYVKTFHKMNEGDYVNKEVEGVNKILDKIMKDLKDTQSLVVDVRFNGGGQDAVNFEILKRFNNQLRHVANVKLKHGHGYSPELKLYLDSGKQPYVKPVYILTSQQSGSAAESFAINSISIPHIKRIGARTQGAISTALEKTLPNSWVFSISNEVGMDLQGNSYENVGVPVDIKIDYPEDRQDFFRSVVNDLEADKQATLRAIDSSN